MPDEPNEKKIIIDEDWKSRIEAEREAARQHPEEAPPGGAAQQGPLTPPTLSFLVSNLYLQAMIALGVLPMPGSEKREVRLDQAKHTIDTLAMLQEKTEGNRTPEESQELENVLHELRMAFVTIRDQQGQAPQAEG